jgi:hypothetical protein
VKVWANSGGKIYMALQASGAVVQVDQSGNFLQTIYGGAPAAKGMATNRNNGHLFVSTLGFNEILDVDPLAKTATVFKFASADGLTANSTTLYGEVGGHILGWRISDGTQVFDSGPVAGADGAVLGTGSLTGKLFVNTNFGQLIEVDLATDVQTVISTGGSRGDLVTVDPNNSLLLTQTDSVLRLTPPVGGGFVPEPGGLFLAGTGILGVFGYGWFGRKRRANPAAA